MKKFRSLLHVAAAVTLAVVVAVPIVFQFSGAPGGSPEAGKNARLPVGQRIYSIAQAADVWPRLTEARIDPVDTHVGQIQTIEVTVESRQEVDRVYARITTDSKVFDLPLIYVRDVAADDSHAERFALLDRAEQSGTAVANAQENVTRALYRGSWTVHDVHDTTYEMLIGAEAGEDRSSVTLNWTDACGIPMGGSHTISSPCTISAPDGVDNGNLTLSSSLTLDANFAFNSGSSFALSGSGSMALCASCQLIKTNIYMIDQDADNYPASMQMYLQSSAPANGRRRYLLQTTVDCNDANASLNVSCATNFWPDADSDGYFSVSSATSCPVGVTCSTSIGNDCYDSNANARPGQTGYFTAHRGDSSFDYDCNSLEDYEDYGVSGTASCAAEGGGGKELGCVQLSGGWTDTGAPSCGGTGELVPYAPGSGTCIDTGEICLPSGAAQTQACR